MFDRFHGDRVAHLLMETRIGFRWLESIGREQRWRIEVHRRIGSIAARIDIDHLDVLAARAGLQVVFPGDFDRHPADAREVILGGERRIE